MDKPLSYEDELEMREIESLCRKSMHLALEAAVKMKSLRLRLLDLCEKCEDLPSSECLDFSDSDNL